MTNTDKKGHGSLDPYKQAFLDFINDFMTESDRACVVLGSAKIETLL